MAKTTIENLKLGVFVTMGAILLVIAIYLIGNRQSMFGETFTISTVFKNANGLQKGNNVRFSGINVGTVNSLEMINDTTIRVNMIIEEKMKRHIKKDAVATIGSDGLVGSMILNLIPGKGSASLIEEGDELISYSKIATQDMLSTLNTTNENAAMLTADLLKVTQAMTKGKGTLGRLLNDTLMATNLNLTISNLKNASTQANVTIRELNTIVSQIDMQHSIAAAIFADSIGGVKVKSTITHLEHSSKEIDSLIRSLNGITREIKNGNGALHYLTTDTLLVDKLQTTIMNIEEGTTRFNENMEALKHNFLTRRYFKKLEKQNKEDGNDF